MADFALLESPKLTSRKIWFIKNHEISTLYSVTVSLREINFWDLTSTKNPIFYNFEDYEVWYFGWFQHSQSAKIHKNPNSESLNVV